jgi:hypothetical protein
VAGYDEHHDNGLAHSDGVHPIPGRLRHRIQQSQLSNDPGQPRMRHQSP